jgi:hypothetical protein
MPSRFRKPHNHFKAIMAAIGESKAQAELTNMRIVSALGERVLEAERH